MSDTAEGLRKAARRVFYEANRHEEQIRLSNAEADKTLLYVSEYLVGVRSNRDFSIDERWAAHCLLDGVGLLRFVNKHRERLGLGAAIDEYVFGTIVNLQNDKQELLSGYEEDEGATPPASAEPAHPATPDTPQLPPEPDR